MERLYVSETYVCPATKVLEADNISNPVFTFMAVKHTEVMQLV